MKTRSSQHKNPKRIIFSDSDSDDNGDIQDGINDLTNVPIDLLRKELIKRDFEPTVVNNLPHWQLSAMLRDVSSRGVYSFQSMILGYSPYWSKDYHPIFEQGTNLETNDKNEEEKKNEEEEDEEEKDINVNDWEKDAKNDNNNNIPAFTFHNSPGTVIHSTLLKVNPSPTYVPPTFTPKGKDGKRDNEIAIDLQDPYRLPLNIHVKLLNKGVDQQSLDHLSLDQIQLIRKNFETNVSIDVIIKKFNLKLAKKSIMDSDSQSDSETESSSQTEKESGEEEDNDESCDDHRDVRY